MTAIVCLALSAAALVLAVLSATRGRIRRAVRWAAVALVPTGLYLTGLITVFSRIGHAIADWAADLVFDPRVWVGICLLGGAVVLGLLSGIGRRRGSGEVGSSPTGTAVPRSSGAAPVASAGAGLPAVGAGAAATAAGGKQPVGKQSGKQSGKEQGAGDGLDDFADVEEILKRRGL